MKVGGQWGQTCPSHQAQMPSLVGPVSGGKKAEKHIHGTQKACPQGSLGFACSF